MKKYSSFICIAIFIGLILAQPAYTKLTATYAQEIITIDKIKDNGEIFTEDRAIFEVNSPEIIKKARALKNQRARVLYIVMGEKKFITELKPATTPPFTIHENKENSMLPVTQSSLQAPHK